MLSTVKTPNQPQAAGKIKPYVVANNLCKYYPISGFGNRVVKSVDDVSLTIGEGEVLGLVGESGCGKSTVAGLITRLTNATKGEVSIGDHDILHMQGETLRRMRRVVQLVFQDPYSALDPRMRIGQSMEAPLAQHGIGTREERIARVFKMLEEVGLDASYYDRYPSQCSGGQLQRVVIGRALLLNPSFLVCDEPTSALDASMRTQILNLLMDMKRRHGLTVLMISHDLRVVRYLCDRIAVMYLGRIVEIADRDELFRAPKHPYTKALIASSMLDETGLYAPEMLLDGDLPSPLNPPSGCKFHTRCKYATQICSEQEPLLEDVAGEHFARCHHWREWG
ncbi:MULTISPECIES: ABC transporter ATP-binding protein [Rhizobium/Agrobacterium group]|jgi:peptide/nickel transport system ATP-binding protein|uniref:ABC transporter ATP-binding protein n=1 Tax=Rhizobium/Agrobacterium group TaxID=227290 RepID=UPI00023A56A3|nr:MULTISPECIES: ABC transporter ATP-binding protein [Rhizobium/Agrobacterium group]EHJ99533.1 nickel import ATP-binding protein NikE [Agrobacterium tumefaciens 5A]MBO9108189.1 ABC transporter ATP-binding protein [Agrobacterium sp. S2/73]NTA15417.1 ABC transporter ATP-binding protein [Agrobacterium tumefaciens]NTA80348.1 ABC transporter ATP-binding protein [Agrobacterium tumefaciens]QTQ83320.1 ABC transporter ATP-binding protein [Agrobacterium tumefaciens]